MALFYVAPKFSGQYQATGADAFVSMISDELDLRAILTPGTRRPIPYCDPGYAEVILKVL